MGWLNLVIPQSVRSESKRKYRPVQKVVKMHKNELCHKIFRAQYKIYLLVFGNSSQVSMFYSQFTNIFNFIKNPSFTYTLSGSKYIDLRNYNKIIQKLHVYQRKVEWWNKINKYTCS